MNLKIKVNERQKELLRGLYLKLPRGKYEVIKARFYELRPMVNLSGFCLLMLLLADKNIVIKPKQGKLF